MAPPIASPGASGERASVAAGEVRAGVGRIPPAGVNGLDRGRIDLETGNEILRRSDGSIRLACWARGKRGRYFGHRTFIKGISDTVDNLALKGPIADSGI